MRNYHAQGWSRMVSGSKTFGLPAGKRIGHHYKVVGILGRGREGEVYQIQDLNTGIHRAAKIYFAEHDVESGAVAWHARKLEKLRDCSIVLQYHHTERIQLGSTRVICLISDLYDAVPLENWVMAQRGRRLQPYVALHVLYHLVNGLEEIHDLGEYHADVHSENVLLRARGVRFDVKLVDFYNWGRPTRPKQQQDILDTVRVFYDSLGGAKYYSRQSREVKFICAGLRRQLILKRFPTITHLRRHLENFDWQESI